MAFRAAGGSCVEKIGWRRSEIEIEALVGVGGKKAHGLILKNEVPDAVEDRFLAVNLDTHWKVRTVADEDVGAFIDRLMREAGDELGSFFKLGATPRGEQACAAEFVAVDADDQPVCLAPRFANPA
jgi:hypothetical protein